MPQSKEVHKALEELLKHYLDLANSGDAGSWNPEEEEVVINARKALTEDLDAI